MIYLPTDENIKRIEVARLYYEKGQIHLKLIELYDDISPEADELYSFYAHKLNQIKDIIILLENQ